MNNLVELFAAYSSQGGFFFVLMLIVAFIAGIISSISPCSLGMLPLIIGYVGGYNKEDNKKLFIQMLSFSVGLSLILSIIGVVCALTGKAFTSLASPVVILLFASVIIILGLNLIGILDINFPAIVKKMPQNKNGGLFIYPFIIGVLFALASSPCSSPILASIMAFATISNSIIYSAALLFCFAIGQCVIIIAAALFTSSLKNLKLLGKFSDILIKFCGIILISAGIYLQYAIFKDLIF